jgi:hypothetical protein
MKALLLKHQDDLIIAAAWLVFDLAVFYRLGLL